MIEEDTLTLLTRCVRSIPFNPILSDLSKTDPTLPTPPPPSPADRSRRAFALTLLSGGFEKKRGEEEGEEEPRTRLGVNLIFYSAVATRGGVGGRNRGTAPLRV